MSGSRKIRINKISVKNHSILHVDYTHLTEQEMIDLMDELKHLLLTENKPQMIISEYSEKSYATPRFMQSRISTTREVIHLVKKSAIVSKMSLSKKIILKGYNMIFNRNIKAFNTCEEAIQYLTDDSTSDYDGPLQSS
jgi:hypothetical protein